MVERLEALEQRSGELAHDSRPAGVFSGGEASAEKTIIKLESAKTTIRQTGEAWQVLHSLTSDSGRRIADMFQELPDREDYPDYLS